MHNFALSNVNNNLNISYSRFCFFCFFCYLASQSPICVSYACVTDDRNFNMLLRTVSAPSCCIFIFCVLTVKYIDSMKAVEGHFFAVLGLTRQHQQQRIDDELEIEILI